MEIPKLPYRAEYAKSGRASCKKCKNPILKDELRLAVMVQSRFFDGMQTNWHHFSCFFERFKPKGVADIEHFDSLRWNDQESIRKEIENKLSGPPPSDTSGKKKKSQSKKRKNSEQSYIPDLADYTIGYAKSNKSKCKVCEEFIKKNEIRISKKDYENEIALQYGPTERWHHVDCFIKAREELEFFASVKVLPGFEDLSSDDQKMITPKIPEIPRNDTTDGPSPVKKPKGDEINKKDMKKQNDVMFKYRDQLESLTKQELVTLFEYNKQEVPEGLSRMLDRLSDAMTFGALKKCEKCKGQLAFRSGLGYQCLGDISEWAKCQTFYSDPARVVFKVPNELKESYSFLKKYKGNVSKRLFEQTLSPVKISAGVPKQTKSVLDSLKFFIHKTESKSVEDVQKQVENLGGKVVKKWDDDVFGVISTAGEVKKSKLVKNIKAAKNLGIHVLPDNFFDDVTSSISKEELINKLNEQKISPWDSDPSNKITETAVKSVYPSKSVNPNKSGLFKSNETTKVVTIKNGLVVDPDSNLEKVAHVYRRGDEIFSVVLSVTDVQTKRNSFYRMQLLESDKKNKHWLFRAWGRIGTTIGGSKVERYDTLDTCIDVFKELFLDKTGNTWEMRNHFKKVPGKMMILDIEYKDQEAKDSNHELKIESEKLSKPVQDLMLLIFDIEAMKKTMLEFELDLNKMPLGKISRKQIQKAFAILSDVQNLIDSSAEETSFVEKTNMFYTLVPHDSGMTVPPLLDNEEIIKQKIEMLNSLMDIEIAYKMLQECDKSKNSIDECYEQLKTDITDLDPNSEEYKVIRLYVKNTHAKTHMNYTLEIENVFKIERKGEAKRYEKFSQLPNRALLWHGSRNTNFVGILSQGLRRAPPEAPVTGYMFGKGIYFADMVSKSANYCNTSKKNPTGLLLLCEVALGQMHELTEAKFIEKLPPGRNSVKGVGKTQPNPSEKVVLPSGVEIPLGKGVDANVKKSSLLYNEYIVYNEAQVRIQYLVRLKFNHKI